MNNQDILYKTILGTIGHPPKHKFLLSQLGQDDLILSPNCSNGKPHDK